MGSVSISCHFYTGVKRPRNYLETLSEVSGSPFPTSLDNGVPTDSTTNMSRLDYICNAKHGLRTST